MPDDSVLLGNLAEEFSARVRQGELPDLEAYAVRHPALAERIRALFPTLMLLEGMAAESDRATAPLAVQGTGVLAPGSILGGYRIEREIGRGGMGIVYEAIHLALNRRVALKVLPLWGGHSPVQLERFLREARTAAGLHHTNIVPVFDVGQVAGLPYYAMQLIDGVGLDQPSLRRSPEDADRYRWVAGLGVQAAEGLSHAHQRGVIHRDIKPSNLLLDDQGCLWITDFGLARGIDDLSLTTSGTVVGTPRYMSPEQAERMSRPVDHRTDIYSLGVTLYEVLTHRPPFDGQTPQEVLGQIVSREPAPPRQLDPAVPCDLETIILKAMAKRPEDRYQTAAELADDLRRFLAGEPVRARRISPAGRLVRWSRRNPTRAALLLVSAIAVLALVGLAVSWAYRRSLAEKMAQIEHSRLKEARQRQLTEQALDRAVAASKAETEARRQERLALERAESADYFHRILLASNAWRDADMRQARELLAGTTLARRGWEWYYLDHLCRQSLLTIRLPKGAAQSVRYSPDGRRLAAGWGREVRVWDAETGAELAAFKGHDFAVMAVAFHPAGKQLASGSQDWTIKVWSLETGREVLTIPKSSTEGMIGALAYSPDGSKLAGCMDAEVRIWDAHTGKVLKVLKNNGGGFRAVAFSPDGKRLAAGVFGEHTVKVWDALAGKEVLTLKGHRHLITAVAFSPNGKQIAASSWDQTARVWDAQTGAPLRTLRGHQGYLTDLAFSSDSQRLATSSWDRTVKVWNPETGEEISTLRGHEEAVTSVAFRGDGKRLASAGEDRAIRVWDASATAESTVLTGPTAIRCLAYRPDGRELASAGGDGKSMIAIWGLATGEVSRTLPGHDGGVMALAWSPDGKRLASGSLDKTVKVWDLLSGKEAFRLRLDDGYVTRLAYSPDGKLLAVAVSGRGGRVKVVDATTGQQVRTFRGDWVEVKGLAFSPDSRLLACGDLAIKVWDVSTGREAIVLQGGHTMPVTGLAFLPEGTKLASSSMDRTVKLWELATGREVFTLRGHSSFVNGITASPKGRRLASASEEGTIKLWDVASGQEALTLSGPSSPVRAVVFRPDGQEIASGSLDGTIRLWQAPLPRASAGSECPAQ